MTYKIPIILGTGREGRKSEHVFSFLRDTLKQEKEFDLESFDVRDFSSSVTVPAWVESPLYAPWRKSADEADGFIIVAPEYNHGYPGELKIFLDSAYKEYDKKPVLAVGVSSGIFGGARMVENLRQVLVEYGMVLTRDVIYVSEVEDIFDDDGKIAPDKKEKFEERIMKSFKGFKWHVEAMKDARNN